MWVFFAFVSLLFLNVRNIVTKFNVSNTHEYISMWYTFIFQIPIGLIVILIAGIQISDSKFYLLVLLRVILDIIAFIFFFKALKVSKLSLVLPFMALLPVLTIFTSFIINGQEISFIRLILVLVVAACCYGVYKSNTKSQVDNKGDRRGVIYILLVVGIYSILDPLHAEILKISAPYTYFFVSSIYFIVVWTFFILLKFRKELLKSFSSRKVILFNGANGIVLGLEVISLFLALVPGSITAIVTAIRSTNIATSSLAGGILFKEHLNTKKIVLIGLIALAVILLIAL